MEKFGGAERCPGKGTKRDRFGCVAKRSPDLDQPAFTTGGKWIHERTSMHHYVNSSPAPDSARSGAIALIRMFEEVRPVCGAKPRSWKCTLCCTPKEDDCEAPVGGGRNGSKLRMQQELREQHNGGRQS